jgi:hypothetical protein
VTAQGARRPQFALPVVARALHGRSTAASPLSSASARNDGARLQTEHFYQISGKSSSNVNEQMESTTIPAKVSSKVQYLNGRMVSMVSFGHHAPLQNIDQSRVQVNGYWSCQIGGRLCFRDGMRYLHEMRQGGLVFFRT